MEYLPTNAYLKVSTRERIVRLRELLEKLHGEPFPTSRILDIATGVCERHLNAGPELSEIAREAALRCAAELLAHFGIVFTYNPHTLQGSVYVPEPEKAAALLGLAPEVPVGVTEQLRTALLN